MIRVRSKSAFTLIEVLLAITILSMVMIATSMSVSAIIKAWKVGGALSDKIQHGDFIMDQMTMGLRSAYYPSVSSRRMGEYGFWLEDLGDGKSASDSISWVKTGNSIVGSDCSFAGSPHRVIAEMRDDSDYGNMLSFRAWQLLGLPDDFDADKVEPIDAFPSVLGFNCRAAYELGDDGKIDWLDEWTETNKLPLVVELTMYLKPLDEDGEPKAMMRIIPIPTGAMSWK